MKKDGLSTKKSKALADTFLSLGVAYLKQFTDKQLNAFRNEPVVIPSGKYRFFVGPYIVKGLEKSSWQVSYDGTTIHVFLSKVNALLFCLTDIRNNYQTSRDIIKWDSKLSNLLADLQHYEKNINTATKQGNTEKKEILLNRYIDAKLQQKYATSNLRKTINSAKYNNFRNLNNETN